MLKKLLACLLGFSLVFSGTAPITAASLSGADETAVLAETDESTELTVESDLASLTAANVEDAEESNGFLYRLLNNGTISIVGYDGTDTEISIPAKINGKKVTSIGKAAFFNKTHITKIELPDTITSIGDGAFVNCANLISFTMPDSVQTIGKYLFARDIRLTDVTVSNALKEIPTQTFYNCTSLVSVTIPDGVTTLGDAVFANSSKLSTINLPDTLKQLGAGCFSGTASLSSLTLAVKTLSSEVLGGANIKNLIFTGLEKIESGAFGSTAIVTRMQLPSTLKEIDDNAFSRLMISEITVSADNPYYCMENNALYTKDRSTLIKYLRTLPAGSTEIVFSEGVKKIGSYAFAYFSYYNNGKPLDCTIPDTVTEIGAYAFMAAAINTLTLPASIEDISEFTYTNVSAGNLIIPEGVERIESGAFQSLSGTLTEITIPASVQYIAEDAFINCTYLQKIHVAEGNQVYKEIDGLLYNKNGDTLICYPSAGTTYPNTTVTIPEGTKIIGKYAFSYNDTVKTINVPSSVTEICDLAFCKCSSLKTIYVPASVTQIGDKAIGYTTSALDDIEMFKIIGEEGSAACTYARDNNLAFYTELPDEDPETVNMQTGETVQLDQTGIIPDMVNYTSSDETIAYVDQNGYITALSAGSTTIVRSCGFHMVSFPITVTGETWSGSEEYTPTAIKTGSNYNFDPSAYTILDQTTADEYEQRYKETNSSLSFTSEDNFCINCYTGNEYVPIHAAQGEAYPQNQVKSNYAYRNYEVYGLISDGLYDELSAYQNTENIVFYRGIPYAPDITGTGGSVADMKASIGKIYTPKTNLSTSVLHESALGFYYAYNNPNRALLEIYAPASMVNGAYINSVSEHQSEYEFLINQGARFLILDAGVRTVEDSHSTSGVMQERYFKLLLLGNDVEKVNISLTAPQPGSTLASAASVKATGLTSGTTSVTWTENGSDAGTTADYAAEYTARMILTPTADYQFSNASSVYVNGEKCDYTILEDGSAEVTYTCKTASHEITEADSTFSLEGLKNGMATGMSSEEDSIASHLPTKTTVVMDGERITADLTWNLDNLSYDPASEDEQEFEIQGTITIDGIRKDTITYADGLSDTVTCKVRVCAADEISAPYIADRTHFPGTYTENIAVTIGCDTEDAEIYYSTDYTGTDDTPDAQDLIAAGTLYHGEAISLTGTAGKKTACTIFAVARAGDETSDVLAVTSDSVKTDENSSSETDESITGDSTAQTGTGEDADEVPDTEEEVTDVVYSVPEESTEDSESVLTDEASAAAQNDQNQADVQAAEETQNTETSSVSDFSEAAGAENDQNIISETSDDQNPQSSENEKNAPEESSSVSKVVRFAYTIDLSDDSEPTPAPTPTPTDTPEPTPTIEPTPTVEPVPTAEPTVEPTPTAAPTTQPTAAPTIQPTTTPSKNGSTGSTASGSTVSTGNTASGKTTTGGKVSTGDTSDMPLYTGMFTSAAIVLLVLFLRKKHADQ